MDGVLEELGGIFIIIVMQFKRAALPVANQVINASVISKDCRIVSMGSIFSGSQTVTCFNAANHKWMTMMRAGRIVLFKMMRSRGISTVSTNGGVAIPEHTHPIPPSLATVSEAIHSAPLDVQIMADIVSCLAVVKNK